MVEFRETFQSPYEQYQEHVGKSFTVIQEITDWEDDPEVGILYQICLEDGEVIAAWPEEVEARWSWDGGD